MKTLSSIVLGIGFFLIFSVHESFAVPPIERVPLENLTILGMGDSMTIEPNQQHTVRVDYQSNFPNTEYVIIYQITNKENQVVLLNWLEGFQQKLADQPGAFVCGDEICYDEWSYSEPYVCGDKICEGKFYAQKFMETSWFPVEPGAYRITAFAWESVDNPTALSPPISIEIIVQD